MSLAIKLNGALYSNFINARVTRSIDVLTSSFSFASSADAHNLFPIKAGDNIEILADNILVMTGYVEGLLVNYSSSEHSIEVSGRGVLADLVDSSVKNKKEFIGGVSLQSIASSILTDLGLTNVTVVNEAGTINNFESAEITSADVGQSAFEFLESFARKRQVFLNENAYGNLVLSRGTESARAPADIQNYVVSNRNNIKNASLNIDYRNRYNQYLVRSQLNPTFQDLGVQPSLISDQSGSATDTSIRSTRFLELNSEESQDSGSALERAVWEANIRRARSFNYTASIYGHTHNGVLWSPNTLIKVVDQFCDIYADLLVRSVDLVYSLYEGSTTTLACAPKDAYQLQVEQEQREVNTSDTGESFID